ncbi:MAG: hypothetical protein HKO93_02950 [Flavobacteriales bacterium]|nr:hypothetical protein [Flavobacteriales bacterium]
MIKKAFRCDPFPWTILYLVLLTAISIRTLVFPKDCNLSTELETLGHSIQLHHWSIGLVKVAAILILPFWFRNILRNSAVLEFSERVSLYPLSLFLSTLVLSCHSLIWIISVILLLGLFGIVARLREDESLSSASFKSGIFISVCSFISPYFFLLSLFVMLSFSTLRSLNWKSVIWHLLGVLTPWYLGYTIRYILAGQWDFFQLTDEILIPSNSDTLIPTGLGFIFYLLVTIAATILMIRLTFKSASKGTVRRRKFIRIGGLLLIITSIISVLLLQFESVSPFVSLMAIPLAVMYMEMFKEEGLRLHSVLFILWIIGTFLFVWN